MEPIRLELHKNSGRQLYSLVLASPSDMPVHIDVQSPNFVCLIAWDARDATGHEIATLVEPLLRSGASYLVCWGPDCRRVHDIIDEVVTAPENQFGVPEDSCIMTTWHESEPLTEAIWFFLTSAWPEVHYQEPTQAALAISVGSKPWAEEIGAALTDPSAFVQAVLDRGAA